MVAAAKHFKRPPRPTVEGYYWVRMGGLDAVWTVGAYYDGEWDIPGFSDIFPHDAVVELGPYLGEQP